MIMIMIMIIIRFVSPHLHQRPCTTPLTRFQIWKIGKCKRQFLWKFGGNSKKYSNLEEENFDDKEKEEKVPGEEPLDRTLMLNQLFIYLFIYRK